MARRRLPANEAETPVSVELPGPEVDLVEDPDLGNDPDESGPNNEEEPGDN